MFSIIVCYITQLCQFEHWWYHFTWITIIILEIRQAPTYIHVFVDLWQPNVGLYTNIHKIDWNWMKTRDIQKYKLQSLSVQVLVMSLLLWMLRCTLTTKHKWPTPTCRLLIDELEFACSDESKSAVTEPVADDADPSLVQLSREGLVDCTVNSTYQAASNAEQLD